MKEYDIIAIGTGSAMNIISSLVNNQPDLKIAVIDKDAPGGICLTKGCIPTKLLLYPAELIYNIRRANIFGIEVDINKIDFKFVMDRMRRIIGHDMDNNKKGLSEAKELDYYHEKAEFIGPYTLLVGKENIKGKTILLCTGSKPKIPLITGLEKVKYYTSDNILQINELPKSICIIGGGYIAAEYGHFFATMGSKVTIIGRNTQFLPQEEPEVANLAKKELGKEMDIITNAEVREVTNLTDGKKRTIALNRETRDKIVVEANEILIAVGRSSNSDILHPNKSGIRTDEEGWIVVNELLETTKPNIWAFGDANGNHLFKHVANYESRIVYYNAFQKQNLKVDYHAIPHAVFTEPEIASVGMLEAEAIKKFSKAKILIGFQRFENTAKGTAMELKDFFVKIIVHKETMEILGAHIIGPQASVLIQEIINLMYTTEQSIVPIMMGIHIHPALSEVVERAGSNLMSVDEYHHLLNHYSYDV
ncbi:MAG: dihydrolipoyl dehydrogenase [Candidatus Heimdallarchaeota archaeon]|nr:dihydrolipoyl dehydrogenase [Candidatus Heimdallarchaeota archaeon]